MKIRTTSQSKKTVAVDDVDLQFQHQHRMSRLSNDLMGGADVMRRAGTLYAEKNVANDETDADFQMRLKRAYLFNAFEKTVGMMVGQVFKKPVVVEAEGEDEDAFLDDVNNMGDNITTWSSQVFEQGIVDGVTFCLAEFPFVRTRIENGVLEYFVGMDENQQEIWATKNAAADDANNWRPYLVHIPAKNVLSCWIDMQSGKRTVQMFRYKEVFTRSDGTPYGREVVEVIRVYRPNSWQTWEKVEGETEYKISGEGAIDNGTGEVPLTIFFAGKKLTNSTARPALDDLAEINLRHWKSTINFYDLKEYNDRPVWFGVGVKNDGYGQGEQEQKFVFGAGSIILTNAQGASLQSVGINPACMDSARQNLIDLREEMAQYGLQLLQPRSVAMTATESNEQSSESQSTLKQWAKDFNDFLNHTMYFVGLWEKAEPRKLVVNTEFTTLTTQEGIVLLYTSNIISRGEAINMLKEIGILNPDLDAEAEASKIQNEQTLPQFTPSPLNTGI